MTYHLSLPMRASVLIPALFGAVLLFHPALAMAYVGPGAGLTAIGTVLALIAAVVLAIAGFLWYPIKRMMRRSRQAPPTGGENGGDPL